MTRRPKGDKAKVEGKARFTGRPNSRKTPNAANPEEIAESERTYNLYMEQLLADLRHMLASPEGRNVLWHILGMTGTFHKLWVANAGIHANVANHDLGIDIIELIETADQEKFFLMGRPLGSFRGADRIRDRDGLAGGDRGGLHPLGTWNRQHRGLAGRP